MQTVRNLAEMLQDCQYELQGEKLEEVSMHHSGQAQVQCELCIVTVETLKH